MAEEPLPQETQEDSQAPKKAAIPWIPLVLVLLFIPIITLALMELVVIPKLRANHEDPGPATITSTAHEGLEDSHGGGGGHGGGDHGSKEEEASGIVSANRGQTVVFEDIISNLAGTMGTRFLKCSFQIQSDDPNLANLVKKREAQVRDAIISTLSSKSLQELEVLGGRNALRIHLIGAINEALGTNLVQELYFLDFIIQ